ncbi:S-methyl-5-thioribose-1-phosphate isomerase [Rhodoferax saidenbachensis]|uniref:Methylthioribose-1-phosphate isomerase n=1 Tax=Rhodoferax saidenbachensis TaxID=1484693 RepID=A0ABU1ZPE7_9BURK|nr:S-methyl-5-thioribose-1-phosphate isomerase [Rhodoferax saidenbachensis]MDR7307424.1 methylthioribose-1-phosphate isomerase [Rhodoferax saidenbachensis]
MKIHGTHYRSIWWDAAADGVRVINQLALPFALDTVLIRSADQAAHAIRTMTVRGAPLIGITAAYGLALALRHDASDPALEQTAHGLLATRPTAVNLRYAIEVALAQLRPLSPAQRATAALEIAAQLADEDVALCHAIGQHGLPLIEAAWANRGTRERVNILTHCNAGWLATVDWGTALAPIYAAHDQGIPVHVWVDETRPRNQGALLTALELGWHGVPHTVVADNAGGHLMQRGDVGLCLVGADRVTTRGDTANKIGTYLKALAAFDNGVGFHVALPSPTIDWRMDDGLREIPIEERSGDEVLTVQGLDAQNTLRSVRVAAPGSPAANPAFDVTPARLVTSFVTERGVLEPHALHTLRRQKTPAQKTHI